MTYNRSEIMNTAWTYFRTAHFTFANGRRVRLQVTFAQALKYAWNKAKEVTADTLSLGDTVEFEYGYANNMVTGEITSIAHTDGYINLQVTCGTLVADVCANHDEYFILRKKVA